MDLLSFISKVSACGYSVVFFIKPDEDGCTSLFHIRINGLDNDGRLHSYENVIPVEGIGTEFFPHMLANIERLALSDFIKKFM